MKKLLPMLALAAFATPAAAITPVHVSLDGLCEVMTLYPHPHDGRATAKEDNPGDCQSFLGQGHIAHLHHDTDGRVLEVSGFVDENTVYGVFTYDFDFPLVTGGRWRVYETTDGRKMHYVYSGTYTVSGTPGSGPSVSSMVRRR